MRFKASCPVVLFLNQLGEHDGLYLMCKSSTFHSLKRQIIWWADIFSPEPRTSGTNCSEPGNMSASRHAVSQCTKLIAITGATEPEELWPGGITRAPKMMPRLGDTLYSMAGANPKAQLVPLSIRTFSEFWAPTTVAFPVC